MSAYSVGTTAFDGERAKAVVGRAAAASGLDDTQKAAAESAAAPSEKDGLAVIVKWVPGEVIGAYAAAVAALQKTGKTAAVVGTSGGLLAGFALGALLMTVLGGVLAYRKTAATGKVPGDKLSELAVRGLLSAAGLVLWSFIVPGSATNRGDFGLAHAALLPVVIPFLAILFGLIAEWAVLPVTIAGISKAFA